MVEGLAAVLEAEGAPWLGHLALELAEQVAMEVTEGGQEEVEEVGVEGGVVEVVQEVWEGQQGVEGVS